MSTSRNNISGTLGSGANQDSGPKTPAGSVTTAYTGVGALKTWAIAGYALRPVTATGNIDVDLAKTLGALTSNAAATLAIAATAINTLGALTSNAAGSIGISGSDSSTLGALTSNSASTLAIAAIATNTLGALTSSAACTLAVAGALTQTLGALTFASYAAWNPSDKATGWTLSNGNLTAANTSSTGSVRADTGVSSGKWYWEQTFTGNPSFTGSVGFGNSSEVITATLGASANSWAYHNTGLIIHNGSTVGYGGGYSLGDVVGAALDMDAGTITYYKNNVSQGVFATGLSGTIYPMMGRGSITSTVNFGASAFTYSPPAGYNRGFYSLNSVATLTIAATATNTLGALTSNAVGTLAVAGACTQTLGTLASNAAGTLAIACALTQTLGACTLNGVASFGSITADFSKTLGTLTSNATGTLAIAAVATNTLGVLTSNAAATLNIAAALTQTLGTLTLSSTANTGGNRTADLNVTLGTLTLSSTITGLGSAQSTTLGGGKLYRRQPKQIRLIGRFTGVVEPRPIPPSPADIQAGLDVTLGELTLTAHAILAETAKQRQRRRALLVLLN